MSDDNIKVGIEADSPDPINRLTSAVDRLHASIDRLSTTNLDQGLGRQVRNLQAQMETGFKAIELQMADFSTRARAEREKGNTKALRDQIAHDEKLHAQANIFHDRRLGQEVAAENKRASALQALIEKRDLQEYTTRASGAAALRALIEKRDLEEYGIRSAASSKLQALIEKRDLEEYATRSAAGARMQSMIEKRDLEEYNERAAAGARLKALTERQQLELYQIKATAQEKERSLNTKFLTSSIPTQLATAEKAKVYASLGGNATEKFGGAAATADIAALRKQYDLLPASLKASQSAMDSHNHTMQEAHALARGLAGSLGGLWLTYGSLVPIAAGAAIAASLKQVVEVGKDVQYQLQFVAALNQEAVPLDRFLAVTAGTVSSVKEAAEGMRALAQNGLSVRNSLSVLPSVLNLAVIGELSVEQAALAATGALSAFGLQIGEISRVGDILAQTAASSNTSVRALTESLKQASVASSLYHVSIEETAAALGTLAKINITGAAAGTAYNNLLTSLYAPTAMASKALKQLGVEAQNTDGSLKNSSALLVELRNALSGYNEAAQARFIGDITTNRGAKAVSTLLQYLGDYKDKIEESKNATGFMAEAVMKLEDTTEGAFRRLKNSSDRTWVKAFTQVEPAVQGLVDQLAHLAGSQGAVTLMANLSDFAVKGVTALIENAKAVGLVILAYAGMSTVVGVITSVVSALKAADIALKAAATTTAILRAEAALLMGALGPIALAITAATLAWSLYTHKVDEVEKADQKIRNSIQNNIDFLANETEALRARNAELDKKVGVASNMPSTADQALGQVKSLEARVEAARQNLLQANREGTGGDRMSLGVELTSLKQQLAAAKRQYFELQQRQEENDVETVINQGKTERNSLIAQLEAFSKRGDVIRTIAGQAVSVEDSSNDKARQKAKEVSQILEDFRKGNQTAEQAMAAFIIKRREYNELLKGAPAKTSNDALKATQLELENERKLFDIKQRTRAADLKAQYDAGQVGDLDYLRQKLALDQAGFKQAEETARQEAQTVEGLDKKRAAWQRFENLRRENVLKGSEAVRQEAIAENTYLDNLRKQNLNSEAQSYTQRGQLVEAFLAKFEADNGTAIRRLQADLGKVDLQALQDAVTADPSNTEKLKAYNDALAQTVALNNLLAQGSGGVHNALFGSSKQNFDAQLAAARDALGAAKAAAAEDGGLSGALGLEQAANSLRDSLLPGLRSAVTEMQEFAAASDNADLKKKASDAGRALNALSLDLTKAANATGNAWDDIWKSIEKSAHSAWMNIGKGGESVFKSIGNVIKTSIMEMLYQLTIKKWLINIGAAISGESGSGAGGVLGGLFGGSSGGAGSGAAGTASSLLGMVNTAKNIYGAISGGTMSSAGGMVTQFGNMIGSTGASGTGMGMAGWGQMAEAYAPASSVGVGGAIGAAGTALAGIAGGVYGGRLVSGGYSAFGGSGNSAVNTGTAVGAVVGSIVPVIGTAIGALVGGLIGGAVNRLFGHKPKEVTAEGIRGTLTETSATGISYQDWVQKGGLFRSDKKGTEVNPLNSEFQNSLVSGYASLKAITTGFGQTLGISGDALKDYTKAFDIKLDPKDATKTTEALTKFFTEVGDEMATKLVPSIAEFARVGESASTTLERLSSDFKATDVVAQLLGKTGAEAFGAAGLASVTAREQFINLSGGLEALNTNMTSYAQNYLSEAEKLAPVAKALDAALAGLSLTSIPKTRDEFKALVQGLDLTDATQVKLFNSLMGLQGAFAQVHAASDTLGTSLKTDAQIKSERDSLQSQRDSLLPESEQLAKQREALDASNRALFDQIQLEKKRQAVLEEQKTLQAQLDEHLPASEKLARDRAALLSDENRALFDQIQAQKQALDKLDLLAQLYAATGNAAGAAAVLEQQHLNALKGLTPELAALTQQLWAAQAASNVKDKQQELLDAYQAEADAQQSVIDKIKDFQKSVTDLAKSLQLGQLSTLNPEQKLAAARTNYQDVLRRAEAGDETARGQLGQAAQDYLTANRDYNASNSQYNADAMKVQEDLARLAAAAGVQLGTAEKSLEALKAQVSKLVDLDAHTVSGFEKVQQAILSLAAALAAAGKPAQSTNATDGVLSALYQQLLGRAPDAPGLDFWKGQIGKGASVGDLIEGIKNSPEYIDKTTGVGTSGIESLYQNLLGRGSDAVGLKFWQDKYNSGMSLAQIEAGFKNSPEYQALKNPHAAGGLAVGPSMINEKGPEFVDFTRPGRVYTAEQTAGMFAPRNPETDEKVVQLLSEILVSTRADKVQRAAVAAEQAEMLAELKAAQEALVRATRAK